MAFRKFEHAPRWLSGADSDLVATTTDTTTDEVTESASGMWETFLESIPRIGVALVLLAVGWSVSRGVRAALRYWWLRTQSASFAQVMSKVVGWVVFTLVVLLSIAITFPSVRPVDVLGGLGFFSLAVGFAFQDILENTLSGVLLLFRQPFRIGDEIEVQDQIGTVQAITIRETRIATFDGQLVIIPNRDVYKSAIRVQTAFASRRIEVNVGVAYESDIQLATAAITEAAMAVPSVQTDPPPIATVASLDASVVLVRLWFWTDPSQRNAILTSHEVIAAMKLRLDEAGIEMPAEIMALQATSSLAAALRGEPVTPGGAVAPKTAPSADPS